MSVHIMKKGMDKRFVDAYVSPLHRFSKDDSYNYDDEYTTVYTEKNHNRLKPSGQAVNCRYIIHATPDWYIDNTSNWLGEYLYRVINTAKKQGFKTIVIPADISSEHPAPLSHIHWWLGQFAPEDTRVYIVVDDKSVSVSNYSKLSEYIQQKFDNSQVSVPHKDSHSETTAKSSLGVSNWFGNSDESDSDDGDYLNDVVAILKKYSTAEKTDKAKAVSLEEYVAEEKNSFADMLFALIDEKDVDEVDCYKRANVNRRTFSKIRTDKSYHPSKKTVLAFAVSLKLTYEEAEALLKSAGYTFSNSSKMDLIVEYFILNGNYNIFEINEALFAFDQPLLGL